MGSKAKRDQKTTQIGVRLDPTLRRRLEKVAAKERRTVSDYVRLLIERALRKVA